MPDSDNRPIFALRKDLLKSFLCLLLLASITVQAQVIYGSGNLSEDKSNLEIFYLLTDSAAANLVSYIPGNKREINLILNLGNEYSMLGNKIIASLQEHDLTLSGGAEDQIENSPSEKPVSVNFVIDNADVNYGEMFRKSFLGVYYIPRNIVLSGNFMVKAADIKYDSFNFIFTDTIRVDEIKSLENLSFPFTQGEIPAEPFFSGLLEPAVAIGTAAVAVFLFFTIRSR